MLVAGAWRAPRPVPLAHALVLGLNLGWANGGEIGSPIVAYRFIADLTLTGLLLTVYGIGLVRSITRPWTRVAIRVAGSWVAAIGVLVLALK
jgi:urease accessory protein